VKTMENAKLAPNIPVWMIEHTSLWQRGADGHFCKRTPPGHPEREVAAVPLTAAGRKSGEVFIFALFYRATGGSYVIAQGDGLDSDGR
jgi:hypothetical protein